MCVWVCVWVGGRERKRESVCGWDGERENESVHTCNEHIRACVVQPCHLEYVAREAAYVCASLPPVCMCVCVCECHVWVMGERECVCMCVLTIAIVPPT